MGVPARRVKLFCFVLCAVLAGFGGIMQVFRLHSPLPSIGDGLELQAVAAAVMGGTALTGGDRNGARRNRRGAAHPDHRQRPRDVPGGRQLVQVRGRRADDPGRDRQLVAPPDGAQHQAREPGMTEASASRCLRRRATIASPIIECRDLHKWYAGVHALKGVSLDDQARRGGRPRRRQRRRQVDADQDHLRAFIVRTGAKSSSMASGSTSARPRKR